MKVALVSYPREIKKGGETVEIIGVLPPSVNEENANMFFNRLQKRFGNSLEISKGRSDVNSPEIFQIIRQVYADSLQDVRGKAEQFAAILRDTLPYEAQTVPR